MTTYRATSYPSPYDQAPKPTNRRERLRMVARKAAVAVTAGLAVTAAVFALAEASKAHSGPAHDKKTEAGIERVISPEMQKIAQAALQLGNKVTVTQPAKGVTELFGFNGGASIDVVMRDFPGTQTPNPADVLAADVQMNYNASNDNPKGGAFSDTEVTYIAPGGSKYASGSILSGIYAVDKGGWTAIDSSIKGTDGVVEDLLSGTIDTADSSYYAVDDNYNSVGPVATAKDTVGDAESLLPIAVQALKDQQ